MNGGLPAAHSKRSVVALAHEKNSPSWTKAHGARSMAAAAEMVQSLLRNESISTEELEQMQTMIDEARQRNSRRSDRGGVA